MANSVPPAAFFEAVTLFNARRYFDCHEVIEDHLWRPLPAGEERSFYQGILQVAVGLHHLQNRNFTGAQHLLERALERLLPLQHRLPFCQWLDMDWLVADVQKTLLALRAPQPELPDHFRLIPRN